MSLYIDTNEVTAVLLADGWHDVHNHSFAIDSYEFHDDDYLLHGGGQHDICAAGFVFTDAEGGHRTFGPLTSVLAVRTDQR